MNIIPKTKALYMLILFVITIGFLFIIQKDCPIPEPYIVDWKMSDSISCHYETQGDALPSAEGMHPPENSIFFHETSCRGGLNSRQACAVESAARLHPDRHIYVYFNSPITDFVLKRSCLSILLQYKNLNIGRVHITEYAKYTALEEMLAERTNNQSKWRIEHTADMLRFITLFKYGGVYLDTDMIVVKPLDALGRDWAAREDGENVNVAALAIGRAAVGHLLVENVLNELKMHYRPDLWSHNGPGAMTRMLHNLCNTTNVSEMSADRCNGFEVYRPEVIYPVHYGRYKALFEAGDIENVEEAYTYHFWNKLTFALEVKKDSPYDKLAKEHCPTIYQMFGLRFGS